MEATIISQDVKGDWRRIQIAIPVGSDFATANVYALVLGGRLMQVSAHEPLTGERVFTGYPEQGPPGGSSLSVAFHAPGDIASRS